MVKKFSELNENVSIFDCSILNQYGNVEVCGELDSEYHILITNFSTKDTIDVIGIISEIREFPIIDKMNVDDNIFELILKK